MEWLEGAAVVASIYMFLVITPLVEEEATVRISSGLSDGLLMGQGGGLRYHKVSRVTLIPRSSSVTCPPTMSFLVNITVYIRYDSIAASGVVAHMLDIMF
jgi:hypothetical protein